MFHVHVDRLGLALGSILMQADGRMDFPMYFASRRFSQEKKRHVAQLREKH